MDLFNLAAKLTLDASEYDRGLKAAEASGKAAGQSIDRGLLKPVERGFKRVSAVTVAAGQLMARGITAAANGLVNLGKGAVGAYASYEQLIGGVETLFKDAAPIVESLADKAYQTAGLSANEYMETVTSFAGSLLQSLDGDTVKAVEYADMAITDMSDNANKMGTDMASIQAAYRGFSKQNYTMLDNLKLGYGGTKSEMERLLKDAEKLTGKKYDISSYSDIIEAIHAIQTEMGITGTTAEEADKTIEGSTRAMKASWDNLLTAFVRGDNVQQATQQFGERFKIMLDNVVPAVTRFFEGFSVALDELAPVLDEKLPEILDAAIPALIKAAGVGIRTIVKALPKLLKSAFSAGQRAFASILNDLFGFDIDVDAENIKWPSWDEIKVAATKAWNDIQRELTNLGKWVFGETKTGEIDWPDWDDFKLAAETAWQSVQDGIDLLGAWIFGRTEAGDIDWPDWDDFERIATDAWNSVRDGINLLGAWIFGKTEAGEVDWPDWDDFEKAVIAAWDSVQDGIDRLGAWVFGRTDTGEVNWPSWSDIYNSVSKWWEDTALPAIAEATAWVLNLFGIEIDAGEVYDKVSEWWRTVSSTAMEAAKLILELFGIDISGGDVFGAVETWWQGVVSNAQAALQWAIGIPENPHMSGKMLNVQIGLWWNKIKSFAVSAIKWVLGIPDSPTDADGQTVATNLGTWFDTYVVPALSGILDFTLGTLGLPSADDIVAEFTEWWSGEKGVWTRISAFFNLDDELVKLQNLYNSAVDIINGLFGTKFNHVGEQNLETDLDTIEAVGDKAISIIDYLDQLNKQYGDAASSTTEWKEATEELDRLVPGIKSFINDETGEITGGTTALREYVNQWKEAVKTQAIMTGIRKQQENVSTAAEEMVNAQVEYDRQIKKAANQRQGLLDQVSELQNLGLVTDEGKDPLQALANSLFEMPEGTDFDIANASVEELVQLLEEVASNQDALTNWASPDKAAEVSSTVSGIIREVNKTDGPLNTYRTACNEAANAQERLALATTHYNDSVENLNEYMAAAQTLIDQTPLSGEVDLNGDTGQLQSDLNGAGFTAPVALVPDSWISNLGGEDGADGFNAKGLNYVPYDNYVSVLHRGEAVLSASQARRYREGGDDGISTAAIAAAVQTGLSDMVVQLGSKQVGRIFGDATTARVNRNVGRIERRRALAYGG